MRSKEDLFKLIQSMSKSEKRYFTLDAQKSSSKGSKYLELFKAINGMETYDESILKEKFPKNLSTDKAYLYEAIMRSMRDFNSSKSISARIKEMIQDAKYLYERGLYDQCEHRLQDARVLAEDIDDQLALLEINREERSLAWISRSDYDKKIEELISEKDSVLTAIFDFFKYADISSELMLVFKKGATNGRKEALQSIFKHMDQELLSKSPRTMRKYYMSLGIFHRMNGNAQECIQNFSKVVDLWEAHPNLKSEEYFKYVSDVSNLLNIQGSMANFDQFPDLISRLEHIENVNFHLQGFIFQRVSLYKLMHLINTGKDHDIETLEKEIENGLNTYIINIASRIALMFNTAMLLFIDERYASCCKWCKDIIKKAKNVNRKDVQDAAYLLSLLASVEYLEVEDVEKEIRNTERYFQSFTSLPDYQSIKDILDLVKKIVNAPILERKSRFNELITFIKSHHAKNTNFIPLGLDELVLRWGESKIKNLPVIKIIASIKEDKLYQVSPG